MTQRFQRFRINTISQIITTQNLQLPGDVPLHALVRHANHLSVAEVGREAGHHRGEMSAFHVVENNIVPEQPPPGSGSPLPFSGPPPADTADTDDTDDTADTDDGADASSPPPMQPSSPAITVLGGGKVLARVSVGVAVRLLPVPMPLPRQRQRCGAPPQSGAGEQGAEGHPRVGTEAGSAWSRDTGYAETIMLVRRRRTSAGPDVRGGEEGRRLLSLLLSVSEKTAPQQERQPEIKSASDTGDDNLLKTLQPPLLRPLRRGDDCRHRSMGVGACVRVCAWAASCRQTSKEAPQQQPRPRPKGRSGRGVLTLRCHVCELALIIQSRGADAAATKAFLSNRRRASAEEPRHSSASYE